MVHASPRLTPLRGSRPSSSAGVRRSPTGPPAHHTSLGGFPPLNCAPLPISLEAEELPADAGVGLSWTYSHNTSTSLSLGAPHLAAHLQHDELNTPDINPPTPFHFPTTSDLDSTFDDEGLMDAICSASKEEEEEGIDTKKEAGTEMTNPVPMTSRAARHIDAVDVSAQVPTCEVPAPNCIVMNGVAYKIVQYTVPKAPPYSTLNPPVAIMTNVPHEGAAQLEPIEDMNIESSATSSNCDMLTVPQSSDVAQASTEQLGMPCVSDHMANKMHVYRTPPYLEHQSSTSSTSEKIAGFCAGSAFELFGSNSEAAKHMATSSICAASVSSRSELPLQLDVDVRSPCSATDVKPEVAKLLPGSESRDLSNLVGTDDDFLFLFNDLSPSGNLDAMNEKEMKDMEDFCEKMCDDTNDFLNTAFSIEENSSNGAQICTSVKGLDHFGLLSSSQEPGQLLTSKGEGQGSVDKEHSDMHVSNGILESQRFWCEEGPKVSPGICEGASFSMLLGDIDNCGAPPSVHTAMLPGPSSVHQVLNKDLDLNTPAHTPLRPRSQAIYANKNFLDNEKLKEKLQLHLQTTSQSQEHSGNVQFLAAEGVGSSSDHAPGLRAGVELQQPKKQLPVNQPAQFHLEFDPALNVPSMAAPPERKLGCTIKVAVINNSRLRAPQKPLKRLATDHPAPCPSIRTKKFKAVPNPRTGGSSAAIAPGAACSSGVGQRACFNVSKNISNGAHYVGGNELSSNFRGGNIVCSSRGNALNVKPPSTSTDAPEYLVAVKPSSDGAPAKVGAQMSNNLINLSTDNDVYVIRHSGRPVANLVPRAATAQSHVSSSAPGSSLPIASKCSQPLAPVLPVCKPPNKSRLNTMSITSASSQRNLSVAGPSCSRFAAVASISLVKDEAACGSDESDVSSEPASGCRGGQARGGGSVVGFSRLPRSEQLALDAEKYRKNLKANNMASTKSRLKKKNACLALEKEHELLCRDNREHRLRFVKLKSQYDVMNQVVLGRPCCSNNK